MNKLQENSSRDYNASSELSVREPSSFVRQTERSKLTSGFMISRTKFSNVPNYGMNPGSQLRTRREALGLSLRDVESASMAIAERRGNPEFALPISRISDIETKGILPSMHRLYSIAVIYHCDLSEVLEWYGVDLQHLAEDYALVHLPKTHTQGPPALLPALKVPIKLDPAFDFRKTCNLGRMIERWGTVPLAHLQSLADKDYTFAYIGVEDFTMYPLVLPGSFLQIDESRNRVEMKMWPSEYQRPIYFVEMRDEFTCCWCSVENGKITLQPHPLSPVPVRIMKHPQEAEVVGQVVGIAMRLDALDPAPPAKGSAKSSLST
jgi:transcriptional regulator with XRE-family HTH domain